jgi:RNA polymerase sigma-70 factor (ECF subfamily)
MECGPATAEESRWRGLEAERGALARLLGRRCRDVNEIDDVIQETFLRAARYRRRLERPERLRSWIASIATNVLSDRVRRESRLKRHSGESFLLEALPSRESSEEERCGEPLVRCGNWLVDRDKALDCLARELREMPPGDRDLLMGFYGRGGSCREVAADQDVSPSVVKVRLFRARKRLLRAVARRFALVERLPMPPAG